MLDTGDAGQRRISAVREYWDSHPLGKQFVRDEDLETGSPEFFTHIQPWMPPFKFPWIMERIEREAAGLKGAHLLEIGCGLGFDSVEFLKRGVRVTATDLTPIAVELTRRHFEIEGVRAEDVRTENVLLLSFGDNSFDAVWANGVLHHTGNTERAVEEIYSKQTGQNDWNTFNGWKEKGFKVEKGSSGFPIWGKPKRLKNATTHEDTQTPDGTEEPGGRQWFPLAYIYHAGQVLSEEGDRPTGYVPEHVDAGEQEAA